MNTMKTAFRLIVFKRLRQGSLFPEEGRATMWSRATGRETPEQTLDWYHQRGEHSETESRN